ncbi:hypothetical protein T492DRAFT_505603 [Pavlovales sp. CCMP2436]|nr:hypothetical protein T492DRAFT_505603 [Pavlovales sp. CCMP2436]
MWWLAMTGAGTTGTSVAVSPSLTDRQTQADISPSLPACPQRDISSVRIHLRQHPSDTEVDPVGVSQSHCKLGVLS